MEDMCYERRRAEACVDESAYHARAHPEVQAGFTGRQEYSQVVRERERDKSRLSERESEVGGGRERFLEPKRSNSQHYQRIFVSFISCPCLFEEVSKVLSPTPTRKCPLLKLLSPLSFFRGEVVRAIRGGAWSVERIPAL